MLGKIEELFETELSKIKAWQKVSGIRIWRSTYYTATIHVVVYINSDKYEDEVIDEIYDIFYNIQDKCKEFLEEDDIISLHILPELQSDRFIDDSELEAIFNE